MPEAVLFIDSSQANDLTSDGSTFTYRLTPPIQIPGDGDPRLSVLECDIVYTTPNVSTSKANYSLKFSTWDGGLFSDNSYANYNLVSHEIVFEEGLYSLDDIRTAIVEFCESNTKLADSALDLRGQSATQKCIVDFDAENQPSGLLIQWSDSNSIGKYSVSQKTTSWISSVSPLRTEISTTALKATVRRILTAFRIFNCACRCCPAKITIQAAAAAVRLLRQSFQTSILVQQSATGHTTHFHAKRWHCAADAQALSFVELPTIMASTLSCGKAIRHGF